MTAPQVAAHFNARKTGRGKWLALCPAHPDRHRSLSIAEGKKGVLIRCMSMGCDTRDVLRAAGLTMEALFYDSGRKVDAKEWAETQRKAQQAEERAANLRIGEWCIRFIENGYTREDRDRDITVLCACAIVLSHGPDRTWEDILRTTTERIAAAGHCLERRMLPSVAQNRQWL